MPLRELICFPGSRVLILFQTFQWQSTATELHTPFARRRYLLVLAGACGCVACLLDLGLRLRRCCACGILPLIVIETEAKPSLTLRTHGQCQRQPPFARGHTAIKKICSHACERRDETTVEFVAERDRVALGGNGGDLMALFGYY